VKIQPKEEFLADRVKSLVEKEGLSKEEATDWTVGLLGYCYEGEVYVPRGTSTKTKLHELGHKTLGHSKPGVKTETIGDSICKELLAEKFAWEAMGRPVTYRIAMPAISTLVMDDKWPPRQAVYWVVFVLKRDFGEIDVPKGARGELERWAKGVYRRRG